MEFIVLFLTFIISIGTFCLVIFKKKTDIPTNDNLKEEIREILEKMGEKNTNFQLNFASQVENQIYGVDEKIKNSLLQMSKENGQNNFENFEKIQNHLEKIVQQNRESLDKIQARIDEKLSLGMQNISQINTQNFELLNKTNQQKLSEIQAQVEFKMDEQFRKNLESFSVVQENLVKMQNSASQMIESSKSIDKLNNIFARTSSKSFGDFGERYLENILKDTLLPNTWEKQYNVPKTSNNIDFCVKMGEGKIGIDCKFPMTKYNDFLEASLEEKEYFQKALHTSLQEMVDSVHEKYVTPNYFSYTMMYLPSDNLYQEATNSEKFIKHCAKKKVVLTSPNNILPQLLIVNDYNRKIFINENAEQIQSGLKKIAKNISVFQDEFRKLGDKLRTAQNNYESASKSLDNINGEMLQLETKSDVKTPFL